MAKKNQPAWQMLGIPEPPVVNGYWVYGRVWCAEADGPQREPLRYWFRMGWLSYRMWGRKIRRQIRWQLTQRGDRARRR